MKQFRIFFICALLATLCIYACSKEEVPVRIDGTWAVELWEYRGCIEERNNFTYDLTGDGCQDTISGRLWCHSIHFGFDSLHNYYKKQITDRRIVGLIDSTLEIGFYELITNNSMRMCQDTICDTVSFIKQGNQMDIIFPPDTLIGCGTHFRMAIAR